MSALPPKADIITPPVSTGYRRGTMRLLQINVPSPSLAFNVRERWDVEPRRSGTALAERRSSASLRPGPPPLFVLLFVPDQTEYGLRRRGALSAIFG
jgi:hypothetical protein